MQTIGNDEDKVEGMSRLNKYTAATIVLFLLTYTVECVAKTFAGLSDDYDRWKHIPYDVLDSMAGKFLGRNIPDSAMLCYNIMANKGINSQDSKERLLGASALASVGNMYCSYYSDFKNSRDCLLEALHIAREEKNTRLESTCVLSLGTLYSLSNYVLNDNDNADEAMKMYHLAYKLSKESKEWRNFTTAAYNIAVTSFNNGTFDSEKDLINDFLSTTGIGEKDLYPLEKMFIRGLLLISERKHYAADSVLLSCFKYVDDFEHSERIKSSLYSTLAINKQEEGSYVEMVEYCNKALAAADKSEQDDVKILLYRLLANHYDSVNDTSKSEYFKLRYYELKDSFSKSSNLNEIKNIKFLEELRAKNSEVRSLSAGMSRQQKIICGVVFGLAAVLIFLWVTLLHVKRLKRHNCELYDRLMASLNNDNPHGHIASEESVASEGNVKYKTSSLSLSDKDDILSRVHEFMGTSQEIFNPNFSLDAMSASLNVSRHSISQVINETGGVNFKTLLNSYRVKEACRRLEDFVHYGDQTIESVGMSVGFVSRSNFGIVFKKETGLTPSQFVKISKERRKSQ